MTKSILIAALLSAAAVTSFAQPASSSTSGMSGTTRAMPATPGTKSGMEMGAASAPMGGKMDKMDSKMDSKMDAKSDKMDKKPMKHHRKAKHSSDAASAAK